MAPKKQDPMEAAKIVSPPPPPKPAPKPVVVELSPEPPPPAPAPEVATADGAVKYLVTAQTTVSLFGQLVVLPKDSIISAESYGEQGMQRILDSNVPLKKLE